MQFISYAIAGILIAIISFLGGNVTGGGDLAGMLKAKSAVSVIDGDTIKLGAQSLRLINIDTPEIRSAKCPQENALGEQARTRLKALLNEGQLAIRPNGKLDKYGRPLVKLEIAGRDAGEQLVSEGLARIWQGRDEDWCKAPAAEAAIR